ncbi:hypothetical protein TNCV_1003831 [Trichonephila clavipes]|nr:hypothetical protein TNCV_1003831 [Trichonephila clavipes]
MIGYDTILDDWLNTGVLKATHCEHNPQQPSASSFATPISRPRLQYQAQSSSRYGTEESAKIPASSQV